MATNHVNPKLHKDNRKRRYLWRRSPPGSL